MAEHNSDGGQREAVAEHLGGGRITQNMRAMDRSFDARTLHGAGRNPTDGLVREALDGRRGRQENMLVAHDGTVVEVAEDGVTDFLAKGVSGFDVAFSR